MGIRRLVGVSAAAIASAAQAQAVGSAQSAPATQAQANAVSSGQMTPTTGAAPTSAPGNEAIVVTGIRSSLQRAAQVKRNAIQVVDSVVAEDIGKLPDPTTAAALQRVPGVQVSVDNRNELGNVRVRGLPDILTTVNGREVFTTTGRVFDLQDMPAEALARIDVYKSQTADLIEGGLAGTIDLELNKPFSFRKPTVVASARGNYSALDKSTGPEFGLLLTNSWDTGIGKIGLLANGSWSRKGYTRSNTTLAGYRGSQTSPYNVPGLLLANVYQDFPTTGDFERREFNAAAQWQASSAVQVYAEGLYTYFGDRDAQQGFNFQPFTNSFKSTVVSLSNVVPGDQCITTRVNSAGQNAKINTTAAGNQTLEPYTQQMLCRPDSITFKNLAMNQGTTATDNKQYNKQIAGGVNYDRDGWKANLDIAYQWSTDDNRNFTINVGQRLSTTTVNFNPDGTAEFVAPSSALISPDNLIIRNAFQQDYSLSTGNLFQAKADAHRELNSGFLKRISVGVRYARRSADFQDVELSLPVPAPAGTTGSPNFGVNEANVVPLSRLNLPSNFLTLSAFTPDLNGGARALVPSTDFLLSESDLDLLRPFFGYPLGRPAYDPSRRFDANEKTLAGYAQAEYNLELGARATLDGVVGVRLVRTNRTFDGFQVATGGGVTPLHSDTSNFNVLPTATARLRTGPFQARLDYDKTILRPDFTALNPALTLNTSFNPLVQSRGSAGNPDLKDQKSDNYDATLEYYFHGGYVALAGYYRSLTNRVISGAAIENYNGIDYGITRPRNIGKATLYGAEFSGQYFFDFLPGAFSGVGVQGSFTLSDSKVGGGDLLTGFPLQGVSKYNYTTGLIYDKFGLSARLVYTYRSKFFSIDRTGLPDLRPVDPAAPTSGTVLQPLPPVPALVYTRPAGRLDFNIGYDLTKAIRIDVGGTNILRNRTRTYYGFGSVTGLSYQTLYDETTYTVGVRIRV